jgi:hypothetical protein
MTIYGYAYQADDWDAECVARAVYERYGKAHGISEHPDSVSDWDDYLGRLQLQIFGSYAIQDTSDFPYPIFGDDAYQEDPETGQWRPRTCNSCLERLVEA